MRDLLEYRVEFPILEHTTYLVSHSLGAMPRKAGDRLGEFARSGRSAGFVPGQRAGGRPPWTVGDQVARIIGAPPGSTVMHQNVAIAEAVVLSCFRPVDPARNRVVYERGNFPSVRYLYQAQPELEVVVRDDDAEILERIDERTLLVPMSHVLFKAGEIQDVAPIVRRAHEAGAQVVLDCYQSAGIVPLDVTSLDVDFAVGGSVKWLCGGPGNAWLCSGPTSPETPMPRSRAGRRTHARLPSRRSSTTRRARREFLTGTPQPRRTLRGHRGLRPRGGDRHRPHPRALAPTDAAVLDLADEAGYEVTSPRDPARRGGTVVLAVAEFAAVHAELEERGILCDFRPDAGIRLGPQFYTSDDEIRFAVAQIAEILETGAYERHLGAVALH